MVPNLAELPGPGTFATLARGAALVWRSAVLAVELALRDLAVRAAEILVAHALHIMQRLLALAVARAPVRTVRAKRDLAVRPCVPVGAGAGIIAAAAIVALFGIAVERAGALAASGSGRGVQHPRRRVLRAGQAEGRDPEERDEHGQMRILV